MTAGKRVSSRAIAPWAGLGAASEACRYRQAYHRQTFPGSARKASGVASSSGRMRSQRPPAPRKVSRPLSRDAPAPENTTTRSADRTRSRTGSESSSGLILLLLALTLRDASCYKHPPMPYLPDNFGLLDRQASDYETSRAAVLPVPFE